MPLKLAAVPGRGRIRVGCSGWNYRAWAGLFYPEGLKTADWLRYYSARFETVEANSTFYRLPEAATFARWRTETAPGFRMAVKASRYLTHLKALRDPHEPLARLHERIARLGARLGPVLYQLPPQLQRDLPRFDGFLDALPRVRGGHGVPVIEFRHPSWYDDQILTRLEARGVAICLHDHADAPYDGPSTGPLAYVRFHGTSGRYAGSYGDEALREASVKLLALAGTGRDVYAYFNNDPDASAPRNAQTLLRILGAGPRVAKRTATS